MEDDYVMPLDTRLDPSLLVCGVWFALTFDDYVKMRLVSTRWRRLYLQARHAARRHFFRYRFEYYRDSETVERWRLFFDRGGILCTHGVVTDFIWRFDAAKPVAFSKRRVKCDLARGTCSMDQWARQYCESCGALCAIALNRNGNGSNPRYCIDFYMQDYTCCDSKHGKPAGAGELEWFDDGLSDEEGNRSRANLLTKYAADVGLQEAWNRVFGEDTFNEDADDAPLPPLVTDQDEVLL